MPRDHEDARRIREALADPFTVCMQLGLIPETGRGRTWFQDSRTALRIPCPWHSERTGSCCVSQGPDGTVRVKCFGCGASGDALSLVAVAHALDLVRDFRRVLDAAADTAGVARPDRAPGGSSSPRAAPPPRRPAPAPAPAYEAPDDGVLEQIAQVLRDLAPVARSPAAMEYLHGRGIAHGAALGWIALPDEARALEALRVAIVDAIGLDPWLRSGLAHGERGKQWRHMWRGRLVIPWHAPDGTVQTFQGRPPRELREGEPKYTVPAGRAVRWPWGCAELNELAGPDTAVAVVEGAIDAMSFNALSAEHGADCIAVAIPGAGTWRDEWARIARGRHAIVALDADRAGRDPRHVEAICASLLREARSAEVRGPLQGKDWNDTWCAQNARRAMG